MSSVYGLFAQINRAGYEKDTGKLAGWNGPYGKFGEKYFENQVCVGGFSDRLTKNSLADRFVIHEMGIVAVIDAVIYNREEVCDKYKIDAMLSDEELIVKVVTLYGYDQLTEINGDFAGAIYDEKASKITLFRDHMGVRPLYFYQDDRHFAFSTDMRGIIGLSFVPADVNPVWINVLWRGNYLSDRKMTEYKYVYNILPGTYAAFTLSSDKISMEEHTYWTLGEKKVKLKSFDEYKKQMASLVTDAIQRRAGVVEGLLGAELSGGVDSGVVSIILNRQNRKAVYHSWSASPSEVPYVEDDERYIINDICSQENITCHYSKLFGAGNIDDGSAFAQTVKNMHLPDSEALSFNQYVLPQYVNTVQLTEASDYAAKSGAKVIFTGHGGDEGVSHRANPYEMFYRHEYAHYWRYMWTKSSKKKLRVLRTLKRSAANIVAGYRCGHRPFTTRDFSDYLTEDFKQNHKKNELGAYWFSVEIIEHIRRGGTQDRLDNVALQGGYSGVRYMVPFLDYRVIDYAVSIPRYLFFNNGIDRYIYRETFKEIMPASLYKHRCKQDVSDIKRRKMRAEEHDQQRKDKTSDQIEEENRKILTDMAINIANELEKEEWADMINWTKFKSDVQNKACLSNEDVYKTLVCMHRMRLYSSVAQIAKDAPF